MYPNVRGLTEPVDLKVCEFRHKKGGTMAINISRWVDLMETAEKLNLTV